MMHVGEQNASQSASEPAQRHHLEHQLQAVQKSARVTDGYKGKG
jgi:hypothetical protein